MLKKGGELMGKPSVPSLELERSMNLQVHMMTVEQTLRHSTVIDEVDDKRRDGLHNIIRWAKEMNLSFIRDLQKIYKDTGLEVLKAQIEKQKKFLKQFSNSVDNNLKQEIELEKIDDNTRNYLIALTADATEQLKNENSNIEKEIIRKRIK